MGGTSALEGRDVVKGRIFDQVQATLLNSECSPKYAVERALLAVLQFAYLEAELGLDDVLEKARHLWETNELGSPYLGEDDHE